MRTAIFGGTSLATIATALAVFQANGSSFLNPADFTSLGTFNPASNVVVDLNTGQMGGGASFAGTRVTHAGTSSLVFTFSSFNLSSGISITFTNTGTTSPAVAFLSQGDMMITGSIRADGQGNTGGPAGGNQFNGLGHGYGYAVQGGYFCGSGAGYGGMGSPGSLSYATPGGTNYNSDLSARLMGGSGGGPGTGTSVYAAGARPGFGGFGGGGGGALQLAALGSLNISGIVSATGANGGNGYTTSPGCTQCVGKGGGGGSGGGILMQARDLFINAGALISANGGSGGASYPSDCYGGGGGGGRIYLAYFSSGAKNGSVTAGNGTIIFTQNDLALTLPTITQSLSQGALLLSWPAAYTNWALETSGSLSSGSLWTALTNGIVQIGNSYVLTNTMTSSPVFFRLHGP